MLSVHVLSTSEVCVEQLPFWRWGAAPRRRQFPLARLLGACETTREARLGSSRRTLGRGTPSPPSCPKTTSARTIGPRSLRVYRQVSLLS